MKKKYKDKNTINIIFLYMNIDDYLNNKETPKSGNKKKAQKYLNYLQNFYKGNKKLIDLNEYAHIINFGKITGSIVNIKFIINIINKIADPNFSQICVEIFDDYFEIEKDSDYKIIFKNNNISNKFIEERKAIMEFTRDQQIAIKEIMDFIIDNEKKTYGLYGYAGTGKTTTIVEIINYLLINEYTKSVAFTAPTNKAVNIMKSKMRTNLKIIAETLCNKKYENNFNIEHVIEDLYNNGIKIDFITIHRLLNYKNDFDISGERVFLRNGKTSITSYEIIIIDECSMIPVKIITHLFEDIRTERKIIKNVIKTDNKNKPTKTKINLNQIPKLIFCGDPAQLPPVNEKVSAIFLKNKKQLSYIDFYKLNDPTNTYYLNASVNPRIAYENLVEDILKMKYTVLKEVVRNKIENVVNLCYHIREWVEDIISVLQLKKYVGKGVLMYKGEKSKTSTIWFKKFITYQKNNSKDNTSNIILTWTNKQTDEYNSAIRNIIFSESSQRKLERFEIGDILMLDEFYNLDEVVVKGNQDNKNKFYTSEQIKVTHKEKTVCDKKLFFEQVSKSLLKMKNTNHIMTKYKELIKLLNQRTSRVYNIWKLSVQRLSESTIKNTIPDSYIINVLEDDSKGVWENDKEIAMHLIKNFRNVIISNFREQIKSVDREIIRPLWRQFNKIFVDPFARVNYGYANSVHRSQGNGIHNVFVDSDDILNNPNTEEAKRCIYTALTRASNEIHLLI